MSITSTRIILAVSFTLLISALIYVPTFGGPGDNDDPVVSLSYMELASRFGEVVIQKNNTFPIEAGTMFILIDGKAELGGVGDYNLIDLTTGKAQVRAKSLSENHLYIVHGGSNLEFISSTTVKVLIRGGETKLQRQAM